MKTIIDLLHLVELRRNNSGIDFFHGQDRIAQFDLDSWTEQGIVIRLEGTQKHYRCPMSEIQYEFI